MFNTSLWRFSMAGMETNRGALVPHQKLVGQLGAFPDHSLNMKTHYDEAKTLTK